MSWNCNFGNFKLFPQFKNWFLAIFEIAKNWFCEIDLFDFTSLFGLDSFELSGPLCYLICVFILQKKRGAFSPLLIKDSFVSLFKWRQGKNRSYMFALIALITFLILPFAAEHAISYNYVRTRYEWEVMEYSNYRSIVSSVGLAGIYV